MAVYTDNHFKARKSFGGIIAGECYELIVCEDFAAIVIDEWDAYEVVADEWDEDVLILKANRSVKLDKVV